MFVEIYLSNIWYNNTIRTNLWLYVYAKGIIERNDWHILYLYLLFFVPIRLLSTCCYPSIPTGCSMPNHTNDYSDWLFNAKSTILNKLFIMTAHVLLNWFSYLYYSTKTAWFIYFPWWFTITEAQIKAIWKEISDNLKEQSNNISSSSSSSKTSTNKSFFFFFFIFFILSTTNTLLTSTSFIFTYHKIISFSTMSKYPNL